MSCATGCPYSAGCTEEWIWCPSRWGYLYPGAVNVLSVVLISAVNGHNHGGSKREPRHRRVCHRMASGCGADVVRFSLSAADTGTPSPDCWGDIDGDILACGGVRADCAVCRRMGSLDEPRPHNVGKGQSRMVRNTIWPRQSTLYPGSRRPESVPRRHVSRLFHEISPHLWG